MPTDSTNLWKVAAKPKWLMATARMAVMRLEEDAVIVKFRVKFKLPKGTMKIILGLAALGGAEEAVRRLHAELNNPFPEEE